MTSKEIRNLFIQFFKDQNHVLVPSSPLTPKDDPTILFTNAGMNQFKNIFLGVERAPYKRAVSVQKCLRAGGKHNDLENVGSTKTHHTFFEMLGNFSFGDYFKKEALLWAWEFVTEKLHLPENRLYITYYEKDHETLRIWNKDIGISKDRIFPFGEDSNFWRMGQTGPCGPCTEIFYDPRKDIKKKITKELLEEFCFEFWNIVFMEFNEKSRNVMEPLKSPCVDTGMGLERVSMILQKKNSTYEIDSLWDFIEDLSSITKTHYDKKNFSDEKNVSLRVLADHCRTISFLLAERVLPSSEGRGYVLRRILRRAIRHGQKISDKKNLLSQSVSYFLKRNKGDYKELNDNENFILETIRKEEDLFLLALDKGVELLKEKIPLMKNKILSGDIAFQLYDTYGFPLDLTEMICKEEGISVDNQGFEKALEIAKEKSKKHKKENFQKETTLQLAEILEANHLKPSFFSGYDTLKDQGKVLLLADKSLSSVSNLDKEGYCIFDKTCFYPEGGGQVGDQGVIKERDGTVIGKISDCQKIQDIFVHKVSLYEGHSLKKENTYLLELDESLRMSTQSHHSATHLLHWALRKVLGKHVTQSGSLVEPERLRFDFTHPKPLKKEELNSIEKLINDSIRKNTSVGIKQESYKNAVAGGALALFGERYEENVRVLTIGDSKELCGGTHVSNTSDIIAFRITNEKGISSGVRRIIALGGWVAASYILKHLLEYQLIVRMFSKESLIISKGLFIENKSLVFDNYKKESLIDFFSKLDMSFLEELKEVCFLLNLPMKEEGCFKEKLGSQFKCQLTSSTPLLDWFEKHEKFSSNIKWKKELSLVQLVKDLKKQRKQSSKEISLDSSELERLVRSGVTIENKQQTFVVITSFVNVGDKKELRDLSDKILSKLDLGLVILVGKNKGPSSIVVKVSKPLSKIYDARKLLETLLGITGGVGGGRSDFSQGSVLDESRVSSAFDKVLSQLESQK